MTIPIPRLVVVLDRDGCRLPWITVALMALDSGADQIQIREPGEPASILAGMVRDLVDQGVDPRRLTANGHPDVAIDLGTNLHLPERMAKVPAVLATRWLVSRSVHGGVPDDVDADYVVLGNVLATESHPGKPGLGIEAVREIAVNSRVPVLGIGGVTPGTLGPFMEAGVYGVAVRSFVIASDDPAGATRRMRIELNRWT